MKLKVAVSGTSELRIRKGPGTSFGWTTFLTAGTQVVVTELKDGFYKLEDGRGWIGKSYTTIKENLEKNTAATKPAAPVTTPKTTATTPTNPKSTNDYDFAKAILAETNVDTNLFNTAAKVTGLGGTSTGSTSATELGAMNSQFNIVDYKIDTQFVNDNLDIVRRNLNVTGERNFRSVRDSMFQRFNRFKVAFPELQLTKTTSYVFFTRPNLNLFTIGANNARSLNSQFVNDPLFYYLYNNNPDILYSLHESFSASHEFMPFLSNVSESFELSDEFIKTMEHGETLTGYKVQYGKHNIESNTASTFSVSYTDDKDLNVYKTHKAWTEYISKIFRGEISPIRQYILKRIIDYACSAYYFLCAGDGETILFWSKYFGVFPTNTPSSALSWSKANGVRLPSFSINYAYWVKEDFNPLALAEFNMNSKSDLVYKKIYEPTLYTTGRTFSGPPFVDTNKNAAGEHVYKLRYRKE